jgi:DNA-binding NarL/FixJ family response regulator
MARILLVGVDLFLRGKFEALLPDHRLMTVEGVDPPDLVIVDVARIDPDDVAETFPDVPILGYTNHTDTAGLRRAHAAGFDRVIVKSALFEQTGEVIDGLLASVE